MESTVTNMNEEVIKKLRKTALITLRILKAIEQGHRSQTLIAKKIGASRQLVEYYLKSVGVK